MGLDIQTTTKRTMRCDNPKCDMEITWIEEEVQKNEDAVPRDFYRFLFVGRSYVNPERQKDDPGKYTFCSGYCLTKWLESVYRPSTPPMLSSELEVACQKIEAMPSVEVPPLVPDNVIEMPVRKTDEPDIASLESAVIVDCSPSETEPM